MTQALVGQNTAIERDAFVSWLKRRVDAGDDPTREEREEAWLRVTMANREDRIRMLAAVEVDSSLIPDITDRCSARSGVDGCVFWIDHFAFTFDPRRQRGDQSIPFVLYPFQIEHMVTPIVEELLKDDTHTPLDMLIEKSRDMGASWVILAVMTWAFRFIRGYSALIGAQTLEKVDDGGKNSTPDSLMGRMRYMLSRLPKWMWRELPIGHDKDGQLYWPENESTIRAESVGSNFGRAGRFRMAFVDEGAWIGATGSGEDLEPAHTSIGDTTRFFLGCSTPNGMNYWGRLIAGLETNAEEANLQRITLHWHLHPIKNRAWYLQEEAKRTAQAFAQEVKISYTASVKGIVFHEWSYDRHVLANPVDFTPNLKIESAFDPGRADAAAFGLFQMDSFTGEGRQIFYIERTQRVIDWFVPFYVGFIPEVDHTGKAWPHHYSAQELEAIELLAGWYRQVGRPEMNYGDQAGWQQTANYYMSAYQVLAWYGISMYGVLFPSKREAVEKTSIMIRNMRWAQRTCVERYGERGAKTMMECMTNYRWPREQEGGMIAPHQKPLHGVYSHGADMLQIWCWMQTIPQTVAHLDERLQPIGVEEQERLESGYSDEYVIGADPQGIQDPPWDPYSGG